MGYPRVPRIKTVAVTVLPRINMVQPTDDGHLERAFFFENHMGLGRHRRQIELKILVAFGVFSTKLSAPNWYNESPVHVFHYSP